MPKQELAKKSPRGGGGMVWSSGKSLLAEEALLQAQPVVAGDDGDIMPLRDAAYINRANVDAGLQLYVFRVHQPAAEVYELQAGAAFAGAFDRDGEAAAHRVRMNVQLVL